MSAVFQCQQCSSDSSVPVSAVVLCQQCSNRLLQVTSDIGHGVCERFMEDGVLCPPKMRRGLFTVAAVDNLDHNPSFTTSKDSFHGTSISLMQLPTLECPGQDQGRIVINHASSTREIGPLPEEYASVCCQLH